MGGTGDRALRQKMGGRQRGKSASLGEGGRGFFLLVDSCRRGHGLTARSRNCVLVLLLLSFAAFGKSACTDGAGAEPAGRRRLCWGSGRVDGHELGDPPAPVRDTPRILVVGRVIDVGLAFRRFALRHRISKSLRIANASSQYLRLRPSSLRRPRCPPLLRGDASAVRRRRHVLS